MLEKGLGCMQIQSTVNLRLTRRSAEAYKNNLIISLYGNLTLFSRHVLAMGLCIRLRQILGDETEADHNFLRNFARVLIRLKWKFGDENEDFRHARSGWLTICGVDVHCEFQLNVLGSV